MTTPNNIHSQSAQQGDDNGSAEQKDLIMMREMPPMSSYLTRALFWSKFALAPVGFFLFNYIAVSKLILFTHSTSARSDWAQNQFKSNTFYASLILLLNGFLLYLAVQFLKRDVEMWERRLISREKEQSLPSSEGDDSNANANIHGQVSHMVDKFLNHQRTARQTKTVPVLVSLLYLLVSTCCMGGVVSTALRAYGSTAHFSKHCSLKSQMERKEQKQMEDVSGLPAELQNWAKDSLRNSNLYEKRQSWTNFIRLKDGRTFFSAHSKPLKKKDSAAKSDGNWDDAYEDEYLGRRRKSLAMVDPKDSSLTLFPDAKSPSDFYSLNGEDDKNSDGFCCMYESSDEAYVNSHPSRGNNHRILCATSFEEGVRNVTLAGVDTEKPTERREMWYQEGPAAGLGGFYWYYRRRHSGHRDMLEFFKLDPSTMSSSSVSDVKVEMEFPVFNDFDLVEESEKEDICANYKTGIAGTLAVFVSVPISFYLTKRKELPVGVVPALMAAILFTLLVTRYFLLFGTIALLATSYFLLFGTIPRWSNREAIVWCHYTLFLSFNLDPDQYHPDRALVLCIIVSVLLNHPVLQIAGYILPPIHIIMVVIEAFVGNASFLEVLTTYIPLAVLAGCGMVSADQTLRKYRAYLTFYARRVWQESLAGATAAMRASVPGFSGGGDGEANNEDLKTKLIE
mmetsp:Transcript_31046/g.90817  ORF Transcript_31046/g.90817 Transcript_31046/m.90817 type:complete len:679 (-) Transcript_31046:2130-4166(-)